MPNEIVYKTYISDFFIFWKLTELCRFVTYLSEDPRNTNAIITAATNTTWQQQQPELQQHYYYYYRTTSSTVVVVLVAVVAAL